MLSITKHIEYLLANHDCVVIPGLGAFLGVRVPAFYDEEAETMYPPCRRFAFNEDLKESDGLLINSIRKAEGVEYRQASEIVRKSVEEIFDFLDEEGEVSMGKIGRLEKASDNSISFVPFERDQLSHMMSCLPTFYVKQAGTLEFHKDLQKKESARHDFGKRSRSTRIRRFVRNTVGAAAAIFIGLTLSTPVQVSDTYKASLSLPSIKKTEIILPTIGTPATDSSVLCESDRIYNETEPVTLESDSTLEVQSSENSPVRELKQKRIEYSKEKEEIRFDESDIYLVIVGSLTSLDDAEDFISNNKRKYAQTNFGIQEQDGKYRVYVATSNSLEQARKIARNSLIAGKYKGAWVTYRK